MTTVFFVVYILLIVTGILFIREYLNRKKHVLTFMSEETYYILWKTKNGMMAYTQIDAENPDDALFKFRSQRPGYRILACSTNIDFIQEKMNKIK